MNFRRSCTSKARAKVGTGVEGRQVSTRKKIGERRGGFLGFEGLSMGGRDARFQPCLPIGKKEASDNDCGGERWVR